jgi:hypothetical protein
MPTACARTLKLAFMILDLLSPQGYKSKITLDQYGSAARPRGVWLSVARGAVICCARGDLAQCADLDAATTR